jgi:hypothetical protein
MKGLGRHGHWRVLTGRSPNGQEHQDYFLLPLSYTLRYFAGEQVIVRVAWRRGFPEEYQP